MEPIGITPQILLERGFVQSDFNCYRFVRGLFSYHIDTHTVFYGMSPKVIKFHRQYRYLHELDMLYRGITGNELTIKN